MVTTGKGCNLYDMLHRTAQNSLTQSQERAPELEEQGQPWTKAEEAFLEEVAPKLNLQECASLTLLKCYEAIPGQGWPEAWSIP